MDTKSGCCAPVRELTSNAPETVAIAASLREPQAPIRDTVFVEGGTALVGTDNPIHPPDEEGPLRKRKVKSLHWERGAITVEAFSRFVKSTGYVTEAERFGWSFVFWSHLPDSQPPTEAVQDLEWWRKVDGAFWNLPAGPEGDAAKPDHPAVHISWNDARDYAKWAGGRLPKEAEWEHAARGGLGDVRYPWGDRDPDDTEFMPCNIWQGKFPRENTAADGYVATAPSISFEPNKFGLYNLMGNVWEWNGDPFKLKSLRRLNRQPGEKPGVQKLLKGGSFLCHTSYCFRYRIAARIGNTPDTTTSHAGFRVVYDRL